MVQRLRTESWVGTIRAVDINPLHSWFQVFPEVENHVLDLRTPDATDFTCSGADDVFHLAADMGGIGFIEREEARCVMNVLIDANMIASASKANVERFLFSSSACVYNTERQSPGLEDYALREMDAVPARPDSKYGWEKLYIEQMCAAFMNDHGLSIRVARLHNVYGPHGPWQGGKEKAPAALCRKVIESIHQNKSDIEIWGDGQQKRSFLFVDDAIEGLIRLLHSSCSDPINLGSEELVTIEGLVSLIEQFAGVQLQRRYLMNNPVGVHGRCSDNTKLRKELNWEPSICLESGLPPTYQWIENQIRRTD